MHVVGAEQYMFVTESCRSMALNNVSVFTQWGGYLNRATSRISTMSSPAW